MSVLTTLFLIALIAGTLLFAYFVGMAEGRKQRQREVEAEMDALYDSVVRTGVSQIQAAPLFDMLRAKGLMSGGTYEG